MAEEPQEPEQTQYTPKGHEIPIPSREQVFRDLEKVAKPRKTKTLRGMPRRRPKEQ